MALFRRSPQTVIDPPVVDTPLATVPDSFAADFRALNAEAQRLGFECFPIGAFGAIVGRLEAEVKAYEDELRALVPLVKELGPLAGVEFPKAVQQLIDAWDENAELRGRVAYAEHSASVLAHALVGPTPDDVSALVDEGEPDD